jgi:hypothetical protein
MGSEGETICTDTRTRSGCGKPQKPRNPGLATPFCGFGSAATTRFPNTHLPATLACISSLLIGVRTRRWLNFVASVATADRSPSHIARSAAIVQLGGSLSVKLRLCSLVRTNPLLNLSASTICFGSSKSAWAKASRLGSGRAAWIGHATRANAVAVRATERNPTAPSAPHRP